MAQSEVTIMQEEFVPSATLRGSATGVVRRVESLPLAAKRLGDFVRGRNSAFEPREAEMQAPCRACRDIEGLFESLLAEAFS